MKVEVSANGMPNSKNKNILWILNSFSYGPVFGRKIYFKKLSDNKEQGILLK